MIPMLAYPKHPTPAKVSMPRISHSSSQFGFTLVELMVTLIIIAMLASLTLAGLASVRQRAKEDKTRSTIRKLHEIVMPQYESFLDRRVPGGNSLERLKNIRSLMTYEMPDGWEDVATGADLSFCQTGPALAYASMKSSASPSTSNGSSECLYLIVSRSGHDPEAMEHFRGDEVGDTDGDNVLEFLDGWGKPIVFLRWAPGFLPPYSLAQTGRALTDHDPFDPNGDDPAGYRLIPLIASGGPDELTGLQVTSAGWTPLRLAPAGFASLVGIAANIGSAATVPDSAANDFRDNITNHDLNTR